MKRFIAIMLIFTMLFASAPAMQSQAAGVSNEVENLPVLEYVYMTQPEYAKEEGQLIVISFQEESEEITDATITYIDQKGAEVSLGVYEIVKGYVVFIAEGSGITGDQLRSVNITVNGTVQHVDLQTFYKSDDTQAIEIEEGDEEILEELESMDEGSKEPEGEQIAEGEIEGLIAEDADGITEALRAAEEQIEEESIAAPQSRAMDGYSLNTMQLKTSNKNVVIVLDPGHGGSDPGVCRTWNGVDYIEKDIALKISKYTKEELEQYSGVMVYMTRTKDVYVGLKERVDYAESVDASVVVSQHINSTAAMEQSTVSGAMIFVPYGKYRPNQAKETWDIASVIMQELVNIGMDERGLIKNLSGSYVYPGKITADYYAIVRYSVEANIPGMIVEHGFCNNPSDCKKYYGSDAKIKALGVADATALARYYGLSKKDAGPGWNIENSKRYYLNEDGTRNYGWVSIDNKKYYFDSKGYCVTGWKTINKVKYYFETDGAMATGLVKVSNKYYWLNRYGKMMTGWFKGFDGKRYYANSKGQLYKGWKEYKKKWYYFDQDKRAATVGFRRIDGKKYYFSEKGIMKTGWRNVKNKWYYINKSGECKTGWANLKGKWYYFNKYGRMVVGKWMKQKKKWYYFRKDGTLVTGGKKKIDKKWYRFDEAGVCLNK